MILAPLLCGLILEIGLFEISWVYVTLAVAILISLVALKLLIKDSWYSKEYWYFSITPNLLLINDYLLVLFAQSSIIRHSLIIFSVLALWLYFENIFLYYHQPSHYQPYSNENISRNYNLISVFTFSVSLYGYLVLLNIPIFLLSVLLVIFIALIARQSMWSNKIESQDQYLYITILCLIMFEFFWGLSFLPISFYVMGFILTLIYYLLFELFKDKLLDNALDRKLIWRTILIFILCLVATLISTRWI